MASLFIGPLSRPRGSKYKKENPTNKKKCRKWQDEFGNGNVQTVNHVNPKLCREEHEYRSER